MVKLRFTTITSLHPKTKKQTKNKYIMTFLNDNFKGEWKRLYSDKKGDYIKFNNKKYRLK